MICRYPLRPEIAFKLLEYSCSTIFASKMICRLMVTFILALRHNARAWPYKTRGDAHLPAVAGLAVASYTGRAHMRDASNMHVHT